MIGNGVLPVQNFAVQFGCIFVLEGKEAADHGKEDDSCTPHIHHDGLVGCLPIDHLWGSVAGRSAGSSQSFLRLVSIGKTEIDYPDGLIVIDQAVLQFEISVDDS